MHCTHQARIYTTLLLWLIGCGVAWAQSPTTPKSTGMPAESQRAAQPATPVSNGGFRRESVVAPQQTNGDTTAGATAPQVYLVQMKYDASLVLVVQTFGPEGVGRHLLPAGIISIDALPDQQALLIRATDPKAIIQFTQMLSLIDRPIERVAVGVMVVISDDPGSIGAVGTAYTPEALRGQVAAWIADGHASVVLLPEVECTPGAGQLIEVPDVLTGLITPLYVTVNATPANGMHALSLATVEPRATPAPAIATPVYEVMSREVTVPDACAVVAATHPHPATPHAPARAITYLLMTRRVPSRPILLPVSEASLEAMSDGEKLRLLLRTLPRLLRVMPTIDLRDLPDLMPRTPPAE